ncbi:hypothetical protein FRX31_011796 [Thalictrum thalictroides]|uniref:Uncharacterized protein n=1 Tax=Thalictrum thalictroides TaxID=46969 RepID=A0A7J6WR89_THATH|nr:hypothetical protein FRX31_011796 [Thalictrum thalictroides]
MEREGLEKLKQKGAAAATEKDKSEKKVVPRPPAIPQGREWFREGVPDTPPLDAPQSTSQLSGLKFVTVSSHSEFASTPTMNMEHD